MIPSLTRQILDSSTKKEGSEMTISYLMSMAESSPNEKKTLWKTEKLLVTLRAISPFPTVFSKHLSATVDT